MGSARGSPFGAEKFAHDTGRMCTSVSGAIIRKRWPKNGQIRAKRTAGQSQVYGHINRRQYNTCSESMIVLFLKVFDYIFFLNVRRILVSKYKELKTLSSAHQSIRIRRGNCNKYRMPPIIYNKQYITLTT